MKKNQDVILSSSMYEPVQQEPLRKDEDEGIYIKVPQKILDRLPTVTKRKVKDNFYFNTKQYINDKLQDVVEKTTVLAAAGTFEPREKTYASPVAATGNPPIYTLGEYILEMADPHDNVSRRRFTECALEDPTVVAAIQDRIDSFYADGYTFGIKMKSDRGEKGMKLDEKTKALLMQKYNEKYLPFIAEIEKWDKMKFIKGEKKMRTCLETKLVQGRSMIKIFPRLDELLPGEKPTHLKVIPAPDMGAVIVNRKLWVVVAYRVILPYDEIFILLPSETIYTTQRNNALTREEQFYGRSSLEPVVQGSRTNREVLSYHMPKAIASTYIPKIAVGMKVEGTAGEKRDHLSKFVSSLVKEGTDVMAYEADENTSIEVKPVTVNSDMIEKALDKYERNTMSALKTTPARLGKVESLNRDNITIMEILFVRNTRTVDEKEMSESFIEQLYQPLFAHLAGQALNEIPVEITIIRNQPEDETVDAIGKALDKPEEKQKELPDPIMEQKSQELADNNIQQKDSMSTFGAVGKKK